MTKPQHGSPTRSTSRRKRLTRAGLSMPLSARPSVFKGASPLQSNRTFRSQHDGEPRVAPAVAGATEFAAASALEIHAAHATHSAHATTSGRGSRRLLFR